MKSDNILRAYSGEKPMWDGFIPGKEHQLVPFHPVYGAFRYSQVDRLRGILSKKRKRRRKER